MPVKQILSKRVVRDNYPVQKGELVCCLPSEKTHTHKKKRLKNLGDSSTPSFYACHPHNNITSPREISLIPYCELLPGLFPRDQLFLLGLFPQDQLLLHPRSAAPSWSVPSRLVLTSVCLTSLSLCYGVAHDIPVVYLRRKQTETSKRKRSMRKLTKHKNSSESTVIFELPTKYLY